MKAKRIKRLVILLLTFSLCTAMCPGVVSAEESLSLTLIPDLGIPDINVQDYTNNVDISASTASLLTTCNAALVGVENSGHDHRSSLSHIVPELTGYGFSNAYLYSGSFTTSSIDTYLNNDSNKVFVSRSHGGIKMNEIFADEQDATYILLNDNANNPVKYFSNGTMDTLDLNNLEIAMFVGCQTGHGGLDEANLVSQALYQGATAALGFQENINCNEANEW